MDPKSIASDDLEYITMTQAAKLIPGRGGKRVSLKTIHRWCRKGLRDGVRLRFELVGGRRCTTLRWLAEFIETRTSTAETEVANRAMPRTGQQCQGASERAIEELRAAWDRKRR